MKNLVAGLVLYCLLIPGLVHADAVAIRTEYDALNAQTGQSMELPISELTGLLVRCTSLQERLGELEGSEKKVMSKKIRRLCELFNYVIASKQNPEQ